MARVKADSSLSIECSKPQCKHGNILNILPCTFQMETLPSWLPNPSRSVSYFGSTNPYFPGLLQSSRTSLLLVLAPNSMMAYRLSTFKMALSNLNHDFGSYIAKGESFLFVTHQRPSLGLQCVPELAPSVASTSLAAATHPYLFPG